MISYGRFIAQEVDTMDVLYDMYILVQVSRTKVSSLAGV